MNSTPLQEHSEIKQFSRAIQPFALAYRHSTFSFVALSIEGHDTIIRGRLSLAAAPLTQVRADFRTQTVSAAEVTLPDSVNVDQFIAAIATGAPFSVGTHTLRFPHGPDGRLSFYYQFPSAHERNHSNHVERLYIDGVRRWDVLGPQLTNKIERELQTASVPYRDLDDLSREYGFDFSRRDSCSVDINAGRVLSIHPDSRLNGMTALVVVDLSAQLDREKCRIAIRNADHRAAPIRQVADGPKIEWTKVDGVWRGAATLRLHEPAVITCTAAYDGHPHHEAELLDLRALPNLRRTVLEAIDSKLTTLQRKLLDPRAKDRDDFEASVWVLLQLLGFETIHFGKVEEFRDASDIFAMTPSGDVLVVECTTGVLNKKDKLRKLVMRTAQLRDRMRECGNQIRPNQISPVIVSCAGPEELGADSELARQQGVLVLCRPELQDALKQTQFAVDADEVLTAWRKLPLIRTLTTGIVA